MFERFTRDARQIVASANVIARQSTASKIRPEHLFRALLEDDTSLAVQVLEEAGAPLPGLRDELDRRRMQYVDGLDADDAEALAAIGIDLDEVVRRIDSNLPTRRRAGHNAPRFSRASKQVLALSLREALALQHDYIGSEHLLLGLVRDGDRVVLDTLAACGVEPASLRQRVANAARKAG